MVFFSPFPHPSLMRYNWQMKVVFKEKNKHMVNEMVQLIRKDPHALWCWTGFFGRLLIRYFCRMSPWWQLTADIWETTVSLTEYTSKLVAQSWLIRSQITALGRGCPSPVHFVFFFPPSLFLTYIHFLVYLPSCVFSIFTFSFVPSSHLFSLHLSGFFCCCALSAHQLFQTFTMFRSTVREKHTSWYHKRLGLWRHLPS